MPSGPNMRLPKFTPSALTTLKPEPLTPAGFEPFGTVIASPLRSDLTSYPSTIPPSNHPGYQPQAVPANQATALKTSPISPLTNSYLPEDVSTHDKPGSGLMSIFSSFPRRNVYVTNTSTGQQRLKVKVGILERHPYTTQTFCPFNYSDPESGPVNVVSSSKLSPQDKTFMLVVVAPTIRNPSSELPDPPDLSRVRAFLAPLNDATKANVAVTYAPGTWHAPMIVLGRRRVDFLVTQFANGVAEDDCQEVLVGSGPDENVLGHKEVVLRENSHGRDEVEVDVSFLLEGCEKELETLGTGTGEEREKWTTDEAVLRTVGASWKSKL